MDVYYLFIYFFLITNEWINKYKNTEKEKWKIENNEDIVMYTYTRITLSNMYMWRKNRVIWKKKVKIFLWEKNEVIDGKKRNKKVKKN